jgi:hypothetical protein
MTEIEQVVQILIYRNRSDLAEALRGCRYELNESSTYGSRWCSTLTGVELYAPIERHEQLQSLNDNDKEEIIRAFQVSKGRRGYALLPLLTLK